MNIDEESIMEKLKKPDDIVAEQIINQLMEKKLLSEEKREEWLRKLSSGTSSSEDWNFLANLYAKTKEQADE